MRKILKNMIAGVRTGSAVYLLAVVLHIQKNTLSSIYSVLVVSALIGLLSQIFEIERLSFLSCLILHFIGTSILVLSFNGWSYLAVTSIYFWVNFVLIYLFIWACVYLDNYLKTQKINLVLKKRNKIRGFNKKDEKNE
ncbi:MAG: DUF3021 domain-containing protein [Streptococcus sp.]|nr:DUF3021 domain-containing protein [Streptococcus sp.]